MANTLNITWLYPDLLNLHGDRGNIMAFEKVGKKMGLDVKINRIDTFSQEIDFDNSDIIFMNVGEIKTVKSVVENIKKYGNAIYDFVEAGKPVIAIGTTGAVLIDKTTRADGSVVEGLGIIHAEAVERKAIYGDDLHICLTEDNSFELMAVQIHLIDFFLKDEKDALCKIIYGKGNNDKDTTEGGKYKNAIFTNALGPVFVKNPWYTEKIINEALKAKGLEVAEPIEEAFFEIERNSFKTIGAFIKQKTE
ncbi:MAG: hypothetical protein IIW72_04630 [Clostridia bacterium]|nr:hypothetical protein [Clostridia bacterium]